MIDINTNINLVYTLGSGVRYRRIFDEGVLIQQDRAEALVLNETAVSFLELCDGEHTLGAIREALLEQFDTSAEQLTRDMAGFVDELLDSGIIHARDGDQ